MKKAIFTFVLSFIGLAGFAQSMSVIGTYSDPIVTDNALKAHIDLNIQNTSTHAITARVVRTKNDLTAGQETYFCFGTNCYSGTADQSSITGDEILAGASIIFTMYYNPKTIEGCGDAEIQIVNKNNSSDFVTLPFHFKTTNATCTTSIGGDVNTNSVLSLPFPNPASAAVNFKYALPASVSNAEVSIFDMQGKKVSTFSLQDAKGELTIDTQALQSGIYQAIVSGEGRILSVKKFSVVK